MLSQSEARHRPCEAPTLVSTQAAPRQAPPRQVASAALISPGIADGEVIYTDDFVTETKPARQVAKKRPYKEEDAERAG